MGEQRKKLNYWKAAMGLHQHHSRPKNQNQNQKLLLTDDDDDELAKSKRPTTTTNRKILSLIFLSFLCCFFILSPYCFPTLDSSNSQAGMELNIAPLSSSHHEDSSDSITNMDANAPLSSSMLNNSFDTFVDMNPSATLPSSALNDSFDSLVDNKNLSAPQHSSTHNGTIWCDRSGFRSDICFMKGDIRTQSTSNTLILYTSSNTTTTIDNSENYNVTQHEKIRPYTRKWETSVMKTIDELHLISRPKEGKQQQLLNCDVSHNVPAVFFSTGGYTGNVYHEFNDGLIPLYITSHHFNKRVVFFILEYHTWWMSKYADILSEISDYPAIDFSEDNRTHCFPEAIVGLRIHDELTIDPALMQGTRETNKTILEFRNLLDRAYWPRIKWLIHEEQQKNERESQSPRRKHQHQSNNDDSNAPKLVIVSRTGSRAITNENSLVELAEKIGFRVEILRPDSRTELAKIYRALNSSDAMIGVHGAAMTHFLFMRPGCVFIQVIPLGTEWASESYYGTPARKMGLKYIGYKIFLRESSLYEKYDENNPVLRDPESVSAKGWQYTKSIYLDGQNVVLDLKRFEKRLMVAYNYAFGVLMRQQRDEGIVAGKKTKKKKMKRKGEGEGEVERDLM